MIIYTSRTDKILSYIFCLKICKDMLKHYILLLLLKNLQILWKIMLTFWNLIIIQWETKSQRQKKCHFPITTVKLIFCNKFKTNCFYFVIYVIVVFHKQFLQPNPNIPFLFDKLLLSCNTWPTTKKSITKIIIVFNCCSYFHLFLIDFGCLRRVIVN